MLNVEKLVLKTFIPNALFQVDGQFSKFATLIEANHLRKLRRCSKSSPGTRKKVGLCARSPYISIKLACPCAAKVDVGEQVGSAPSSISKSMLEKPTIIVIAPDQKAWDGSRNRAVDEWSVTRPEPGPQIHHGGFVSHHSWALCYYNPSIPPAVPHLSVTLFRGVFHRLCG